MRALPSNNLSVEQHLSESIKKLFSLAFYTIEHQETAERLTKKVFSRTYRKLTYLKKPDFPALESRSIRRLFISVCKTQKKTGGKAGSSSECIPIIKTAHQNMLNETLSGLSVKERFIVLLFILYHYPPARISDMLRTPFFSPDKQVCLALSEAAANQIRIRYVG